MSAKRTSMKFASDSEDDEEMLARLKSVTSEWKEETKKEQEKQDVEKMLSNMSNTTGTNNNTSSSTSTSNTNTPAHLLQLSLATTNSYKKAWLIAQAKILESEGKKVNPNQVGRELGMEIMDKQWAEAFMFV